MGRELIADFDEFRELREKMTQDFGDLRDKVELIVEGVVGINKRLDAAQEERKQEMKEIRSLFTSFIKNLDGRVQAVEKTTSRHTREIAALRRRSVKPRPRPA